jgi:hypothetical protein
MVRAEDEVVALLSKLPDDCSVEDIQYHLYVMEEVRHGLDRAAAEGGIPQRAIPGDGAARAADRCSVGRSLVAFI